MRGLLRQDTGFCLYPWTGARRKGCQPHPGTPAGWSWDEQKPGLPRHPWIPSARSSQQCWCSTLAPWRSHYWQLQKRQKEEVTIYLSGRFPCRAAFVPQMSTCHFQHPFCHQLPSTGSTLKNGKPVSVDTPLISPFKTQYICKNIHQICSSQRNYSNKRDFACLVRGSLIPKIFCSVSWVLQVLRCSA